MNSFLRTTPFLLASTLLLACASDESSEGAPGPSQGGTAGAPSAGGGAQAGANHNDGAAGTSEGAAGSAGASAGTAGTSSGAAGAAGTNAGTAGAAGTSGGAAGAGGANAGAAGSGSGTGGAAGQTGGARPAGWLYTDGNAINVANGKGGGARWMGRGVNLDDIFFCGYNNTLWDSGAATQLGQVVAGLISGWKPNFVRVSLSMASYATESWVSGDASVYKTPMTQVIDALGANPGVYVLVTLRSDASMIGQDQTDGDAEATGIPSDATSTPDAGKFPDGTDATYRALVDTFASSPFVLFGVTNEPGGNKQTNATIAAAMSHAVGVIRAEEDKLGATHHLVSVQGNGWTSDISFYASSPLPFDNVVYEVHGYPPSAASYTYDTLPVIVGEYGSLPDAAAFYADVEAKQIPNLAWDFDPLNNCAPDLLAVTGSASNLTPSAWGATVKAYLAMYSGK